MGKGFRIHDVDDRVVLEDAQDSVEVLLCDEVGDVEGTGVVDYFDFDYVEIDTIYKVEGGFAGGRDLVSNGGVSITFLFIRKRMVGWIANWRRR